MVLIAANGGSCVMKMAKENEDVNRRWIGAWLVAGALVLCAPVTSSAINSVTPASPTTPAARFSPGVADIVKLVDAKVDLEVIKTYIKSSPTAYNPSATEIIALKDQGVGPEILTAMLQRGAEVCAQSMRVAPAAAPLYPGAVNPNYPPAQAYNYGPQPVYANYAPSYPAYSDTYPADMYDYPAYNYGYSWPYCGSSFYCGLGCYPYGGYCGYPYGCFGYGYPYGWGGRGYGGYYGGRGYVGGRGNYGFGARSAAFAGSRGGFRSFSMGGRVGGFARPAGGFRSGGGFGGRSVSFASRGGGFGGGGHGGGGHGGR